MSDPWAEEERLRRRILSAAEGEKLDAILRRAEYPPDETPRRTKVKLILLGLVWTIPFGAMVWLVQTTEESSRVGLQFATWGVLSVGAVIALWILKRDVRAANEQHMAPYRRQARQYSWEMRYGRRGWIAAREDEVARAEHPIDLNRNLRSSRRYESPWRLR